MILTLGLAAMMIALTTVVHGFGLAVLARLEEAMAERDLVSSGIGRGVIMVSVVLGLFALHAVEIWLYAALYLHLGVVQGLEEALYFSTSTFTTVGFGDIVLADRWRLLSAIESANGFLLIGWTTAYLFEVSTRMRRQAQAHKHLL